MLRLTTVVMLAALAFSASACEDRARPVSSTLEPVLAPSPGGAARSG